MIISTILWILVMWVIKLLDIDEELIFFSGVFFAIAGFIELISYLTYFGV